MATDDDLGHGPQRHGLDGLTADVVARDGQVLERGDAGPQVLGQGDEHLELGGLALEAAQVAAAVREAHGLGDAPRRDAQGAGFFRIDQGLGAPRAAAGPTTSSDARTSKIGFVRQSWPTTC